MCGRGRSRWEWGLISKSEFHGALNWNKVIGRIDNVPSKLCYLKNHVIRKIFFLSSSKEDDPRLILEDRINKNDSLL